MRLGKISGLNGNIIDFGSIGRRKAARHWMASSGSEYMALFRNLWTKDREIVSEFLQTPEGAGVTVPKLHLHPKRCTRLFVSVFYMEEDVQLAFVEFVISKFGYEILSREYAG